MSEPGLMEIDRFLGLPPGRLAAVVGELRAAGLTVATAESLTGGLLGAALSSVPGSSAVLRGGLIVYATDLKHDLAGVPAELLAQRGPVDAEVAVALAAGAARRCGADLGVGLTGVAGPDPQHGHPPGTWFVAVSGPRGPAAGNDPGAAPAPPAAPTVTLSSAQASQATLPGIAAGPRDDPAAARHRIRQETVAAALTLLSERCASQPR